MRTHLTRRSAGIATTGVVAALLAFGPSGGASAEPNPAPINPYYYTAPELPVFDGIPFALSRDPQLPGSVADLRSGDPSCAAPGPLDATDAGSAEGYTLPVRIKVTNGMMLAGYSPAAAHWRQGVPFSLQLRGLTGWVNARVQLPSMKILVDPADAVMCDGARLAVAQPGTAPYPDWDWAAWDDPGNGSWSLASQADGTLEAAPPGTFISYIYRLFGADDPGQTLVIENAKVKSVEAALADLTPNGALKLRVDLDIDLDVVRGDHQPGVQFPLGVSGTFTTEVKAPFAPTTANVPWDVGKVQPAKHPSYLPPTTLPGAVEGATSTVGSSEVDIDVSRLNDVTDAQAKGIATSLYSFLYGVDPWGQGIVFDEPNGEQYSQWSGNVSQGLAPFFPPDRGVADVSADMTIERIGLPKGPPSGYGFD